MQDLEIVQKVLDTIAKEPMNLRGLSIKAKMDVRTFKKFLELIRIVQSSDQVLIETIGFEVKVRKESRNV